ncbi:MAG: hypothetical protein N2169_06070 [bacterium]|nr:hypothetical protein [bacterium]
MGKIKTIMIASFVLIIVSIITIIVVLANKKYIIINGKAATDYIWKDNNLYISVGELEKAGAGITKTGDTISIQFVPVGGRYQAEGVEGFEGEWVSNNAWRVRVSEVTKTVNPFVGHGEGYSVRIEMSNLLGNPVSPLGTGLQKVIMVDSDENTLDWQQPSFIFNSVAPGSTVGDTVKFGLRNKPDKKIGKPKKVIFFFINSGGKKYPNIRINLKSN